MASLIILNKQEKQMLEFALDELRLGTHPKYPYVTDFNKVWDKLKSEPHGFRMTISETLLHQLYEVLYWYSKFVPQTKAESMNFPKNEYAVFAFRIVPRDQHKELFDFNPKDLNPKNDADVARVPVSDTRTLQIRELNGVVDYLKECHKFSDETEKEFQTRIDECVLHTHCKEGEKTYLIQFNQLHQYKITDQTNYF